MPEVLDSLVIATPIPGGFSWTLASRLGQLLATAEERYGSRDREFTILGAEFRDGAPGIWFPGNRGHVVVQLGCSCLMNEVAALHQLAHECIHLLNPIPTAASVLEEGLATWFARERVRALLKTEVNVTDPRYRGAEELVTPLMAGYPDGIRQIRAVVPSLSSVDAGLLASVYPFLPPELVERLTAKFDTASFLE